MNGETTAVWWVAQDSDLDTLTLFWTEERAQAYAEAIGEPDNYGTVDVLSDSAAGQLIIDAGAEALESEHSIRARWVTDQVATWIANDGTYYEHARMWAGRDAAGSTGDAYPLLRDYLRRVLSRARQGEAAWHVAQELAPNDYGRVRWAEVADQLLGE